MKILLTALAVVLCWTLGGVALAGDPHTSGTKGQPGKECEDVHPGHSASAPGSAFNENGKAGTVYANPDSRGGLSSGNTHVVSQYDVACFQQSLRMQQQSARTLQQSTGMMAGRGIGQMSAGHVGGHGR
jgi:hypothetical protein